MSGNCWSARLCSAQKSSFFSPVSKLQLKGCYELKHTTFSSTSAPYCSPVKVSVLYLLFGGSSWAHLTMKLSGLLWVDVHNFCPQLTSLQVLGQLQVMTKINDIFFWQSCWRVRPNWRITTVASVALVYPCVYPVMFIQIEILCYLVPSLFVEHLPNAVNGALGRNGLTDSACLCSSFPLLSLPCPWFLLSSFQNWR